MMTDDVNAAKRQHVVVMTSVWNILTDNVPTFKQNGPIGGDVFKQWCTNTFEKYESVDLVTGADLVTKTSQDNFSPSLSTFLSNVKNAKMAREINSQLLGSVSAPGEGFKPARIRTDKEFLKKWRAMADKIAASPTSRAPSDDDVETFEQSYKNLGLHRIWGPLPEGFCDDNG